MSAPSQFALLGQRRFLPFFLTQALGAFNDNVFKWALTILIGYQTAQLADQLALYNNLAAGLFILPFFLFSATSGQLADKFDKARLAVWIKWFEIVVMCGAAYGFWLHASQPLLAIWWLLGMLFLMGVHSTLFGPLKYAILPQVLDERELVGGNGLVEMGTFLAILVGTLLGSNLISIPGWGVVVTCATIIGLAVVGLLTAKAMPPSAPVDPQLKINPNIAAETVSTLKLLSGNRTVFLSCLGISWFWFFGSTYITQLLSWNKEILGGGPGVFSLLLAVFSISTGIGSLLCERMSKHRVEIGLVPFGSIGMTLFGIDLYFAMPQPTGAHDLTVAQFLVAPGSWRVLVDLAGMAVFSGFFIVPLFALVQQRSEPRYRSRIIAANNILNALFMVAAAVVAVALLKFADLSIPQLLLITALLNAVVAVYIYTLVPEFLLRFLIWLLINTLYRVKVEGLERIPEEGPVLLVCNHVSFVDALIVGGTIPRPTRFVMYYKIFNTPVLRFFFRTARAIPIGGAKENPQLLENAMNQISEALRAGEVVCIFPEGALTADGEIAAFRTGVERILARDPVPVMALALQGLWGSVFSRWNKAMGKVKLPRRFWSKVGLRFALPQSPEGATAAKLEHEVRELRGDWA